MRNNLFKNIPDDLPEEISTILAENENVKIERIVSEGHASPAGFWYDQEQNEWVLLLAGSTVLTVGDGRIELNPGDYLLIPAHQRHRIESTSATEKTIWLAIFY